MKKTILAKLAALAIVLTVVLNQLPPPCCEGHKGTDERCPPPSPPVTRDILGEKTSG